MTLPPSVPPVRPVPRPAPDQAPAPRRPPSRVLLARWAVLAVGAGVVVGLAVVAGNLLGRGAPWERYPNGELPDAALVVIDGEHRLVAEAAEAFADLWAAAATDGIELRVNSAYRTLAEQRALVDELGLLEDGGRAAAPGTSEHGWGVAVDLELDWEALVWMREHAPAFGFAETIPDEPWHWAYRGR